MECGSLLAQLYMASPDWVKAVWVTSGPGFVLAVLFLVMRHRVQMRRLQALARPPARGWPLATKSRMLLPARDEAVDL